MHVTSLVDWMFMSVVCVLMCRWRTWEEMADECWRCVPRWCLYSLISRQTWHYSLNKIDFYCGYVSIHVYSVRIWVASSVSAWIPDGHMSALAVRRLYLGGGRDHTQTHRNLAGPGEHVLGGSERSGRDKTDARNKRTIHYNGENEA